MTGVEDSHGDDALLETAAAWQLRLAESDGERHRPAFERWLDDSESHRAAFDKVARSWSLFDAPDHPALREASSAALASARAGHHRRTRIAPAAALTALAASLLLVLLLWPMLENGERYRTATAEQRSITLADGSRLSLDSASAVTVRYSDDRRELWLDQGQARFDVAHDAGRPFTVHAGGRAVTATGTAFNIDRVDTAVVITLIEGSVRVASDTPAASQAIGLRAGQQLAVGTNGDSRVTRVETSGATAWQGGRLIFEDEPLVRAAERINRHTNRKVVLADRHAAGLRVSGVFKASEADSFAGAIASYLPVRVVTATADQVTLASRPVTVR